jgi:hypothetical protein
MDAIVVRVKTPSKSRSSVPDSPQSSRQRDDVDDFVVRVKTPSAKKQTQTQDPDTYHLTVETPERLNTQNISSHSSSAKTTDKGLKTQKMGRIRLTVEAPERETTQKMDTVRLDVKTPEGQRTRDSNRDARDRNRDARESNRDARESNRDARDSNRDARDSRINSLRVAIRRIRDITTPNSRLTTRISVRTNDKRQTLEYSSTRANSEIYDDV